MTGRTQNIGFTRVIDTVELSDAFRRHAAYDYPAIVSELVAEARSIAVLSTYYDMQGDNHKILIERMRRHIERAAFLSQKLGADRLVLPIDGHRDSVLAQFLKKSVLAAEFANTLPVKVVLQSREYTKDLSALGPIDVQIKTALDEGVRGLARIKSTLKYKWSA